MSFSFRIFLFFSFRFLLPILVSVWPHVACFTRGCNKRGKRTHSYTLWRNFLAYTGYKQHANCTKATSSPATTKSAATKVVANIKSYKSQHIGEINSSRGQRGGSNSDCCLPCISAAPFAVGYLQCKSCD